MTHNEANVANFANILVCSAWLPEQRCLRLLHDHAAPVRAPEARACHLSASELHEAELILLERAKVKVKESTVSAHCQFLLLGVGSFAAQETLLLHLAMLSQLPDMVCFIGTAGVLAHSSAAFASPFAVRLSRACWFDAALAKGESYLPEASQAEHLLESVRGAETAKRSFGSVPEFLCSSDKQWISASTTGITRQALSSYPQVAQFENLELYGFARACKSFNLPWFGYLGVSNSVGPNAHEQWKNNHFAASCMAQELFLENHFAFSRR